MWIKGEVELGADREVKKLSQNMLVVTPKASIVNDDATTKYTLDLQPEAEHLFVAQFLGFAIY